jgi:hypothetical protein
MFDLGFFSTTLGIVASMATIIGTIIGLLVYFRDRRTPNDNVNLPSSTKAPLPTRNFTAQLGHPSHPGVLPKDQRLQQIQPGQNPYCTGTALPGNSPVFYGRNDELQDILNRLRSNKPANINILGERRIGKSSLLNQVYQAIAAESNLVSIYATAQDWQLGDNSQSQFFGSLHQAIAEALRATSPPVHNYEGVRDFIRQYADKRYRFVLLIDEFDKMTGNVHFNTSFFSQLRVLGYQPEYQFGYVLASRASVSDICQQGKIDESKFHNIFGHCPTLGLLTQTDAKLLIQEPMQRSLGRGFKKDVEEIFDYAGYQPAFIQIVAAAYWEARYSKSELNYYDIEQALRGQYRDLWEHQSPNAQHLLAQVAQGHALTEDNCQISELQHRGLLDEQRQLFSKHFAKLIREL